MKMINSILVKNSQHSKEFNKFCPSSSNDDLCLVFCIYPSSTYVFQVPKAASTSWLFAYLHMAGVPEHEIPQVPVGTHSKGKRKNTKQERKKLNEGFKYCTLKKRTKEGKLTERNE